MSSSVARSFARRTMAVLSFVAALGVAAPEANAGAWVPAPGSGYLKLWVRYLPGFWFTAGDGQRYDYGSYHELSANAYVEVGLVDGLALWVHAPVVQAFGLEDTRARMMRWHTTPGDPTVGLRLRVAQAGRASFALDASLRGAVAPGQEVQPVYSSMGPDFRPVGALRIGNGSTDAALAFSMGYATERFFVAGSFGAMFRSNGFDPAGTFSVEGGGRLARGRVGLRGRVNAFLSLPVGSAPRHESPSGMGNGTRYWGLALEADVRVATRWDLGLSFEGGIGPLLRQTGGPVINLFAAATF